MDLISCIMDAEDDVNEMLLRHRGDSPVIERSLTFENEKAEIYVENTYTQRRRKIMKWSTALLLLSAIRDFAAREPHYTTFDFDVYNVTLSTSNSIVQGYVAPFGDTERVAAPADVATF